MKLSSYPFIRFTLSLIAGILVEIYFKITFIPVTYILLPLCVLYLLCNFISGQYRFGLKSALGTLSLIITFLFGIVLCQLRNDFNKPDHLSPISSSIESYKGTVISEIEEKASTYKCVLLVNKVRINGKWLLRSGRLLLYVYKQHEELPFKYGDALLIKGEPKQIPGPLNPFEFDLKRYYSFQGIAHQHFLSKNDYAIIDHDKGNSLYAFSLLIRHKINDIFIKYIPSERERNIASALILGIKNPLDSEIKSAFSATGTMHVLAVSGMHVGIIYGALLFLTSFMLRFRYGNIVRGIMLGLLLWIYAFVTGLCPSVLRAVAMLTLVIVANIIGRKNIIYNTLFITAFILLCYNPYLIMEVGFQLSFLAVLGIIFIFPIINAWIDSDNRIFNWFWEIIGMSIAAQLATFPVSLYYFHQFPNYFLVSNLVVIPLAILIMYAGFGFLLLSIVPVAGFFAGNLIEKLVYGLNQIVLLIESFPYSTLKSISISSIDTWLIYGMILGLILTFLKRRFYIVVSLSLMVLVFSYNQINEIITQKQQHQITFYHVNKCSAIDIIDGQKTAFLSNPLLPINEFQMQFHVLNHRWASGVTSTTNAIIQKDLGFGKLVVWHGKKILLLERNTPIPSFKQKIKVDYILLENNITKSFQHINDNFAFGKIIVDGSNSRYTVSKLEAQAKRDNIDVWFTYKTGAFHIYSASVL